MKGGAAHRTEEVISIAEELVSGWHRPPISPMNRRQRGGVREPYPLRGYAEFFGNLPLSSTMMSNNFPAHIQAQQLSYFQLPVHLRQSLVIIDNSPLARVYTDYRDAARQMLANGTPSEEVLGPDFTEVDLFFRKRRPSDFHTASTWACELSKTFIGLESIYVQLAGIFLLKSLMRWTVAPSQRAYANMPQMIRPTASQCLIPHSGQIDLCPLSPVRDALIDKMQDVVDLMIDSNVNCNWPYPLSSCIEIDSATGHRKLTHLFEKHVAVLENWTLNATFLNIFPELEGRIGINDGFCRIRKDW